jgi:hypothetical protein
LKAFGLSFGLCGLANVLQCAEGLLLNPNCPKGQKRVGKTKSSSKQSFLFNDLVISHFLVLSLFFHLAGNGHL